MTKALSTVTSRPLARSGIALVPALFTEAGDKASFRLIEFLTANIHNKNTRNAYALAVRRFSGWCAERGFRLAQLTPIHVAAYVEQMGADLAKPSVKQHLAALRMLFDYLVIGQVVPHNPSRESVADTEVGLYGTATQGEIAQDRDNYAGGQGLDAHQEKREQEQGG